MAELESEKCGREARKMRGTIDSKQGSSVEPTKFTDHTETWLGNGTQGLVTTKAPTRPRRKKNLNSKMEESWKVPGLKPSNES